MAALLCKLQKTLSIKYLFLNYSYDPACDIGIMLILHVKLPIGVVLALFMNGFILTLVENFKNLIGELLIFASKKLRVSGLHF
jgi:hypothetical protein